MGSNEKLSLVQIIIATGRTHQIRVHLKYKGTPVLGDSLYGSASANKFFDVQRQLLHAFKLKFTHPMTKEEMDLTAPLPPDMLNYIEKILPKGVKSFF